MKTAHSSSSDSNIKQSIYFRWVGHPARKKMNVVYERETHINMDRTSDKMRIYTTEYHVMNKLDKYVEESEDWNLIEIGRYKGEIISKTYEAPRKLLTLRKKKVVMSEEQKNAAAQRMKAYREKKKDGECDDTIEFEDLYDNGSEESSEESSADTNTNNGEGSFQPEKSRLGYERQDVFELAK